MWKLNCPFCGTEIEVNSFGWPDKVYECTKCKSKLRVEFDYDNEGDYHGWLEITTKLD